MITLPIIKTMKRLHAPRVNRDELEAYLWREQATAEAAYKEAGERGGVIDGEYWAGYNDGLINVLQHLTGRDE